MQAGKLNPRCYKTKACLYRLCILIYGGGNGGHLPLAAARNIVVGDRGLTP